MLKEFRDFINRGNVMELAVAVVLGTAFNQIITSIVEDIFTPLIGMIIGGINFEAMALQVGDATLTYGNFLQAVINFILTALALFIVVKAYNRTKKKKEAVTPPPEEVILLTQIRDLLRENGSGPTTVRRETLR